MIRFLLGVALVSACALPAAALEVTADDTTDTYAVSGAVLVPGSFAEAQEAARCSDCHWRIIPICATGSLDDRRACVGIDCPAGSTVAEAWRADGPMPPPVGDPAWQYRGIACLSAPPVPVSTVASLVPSEARVAVPPLRPTSQPAGVALTGLPVLFASNQPASVQRSVSVAGLAVAVRATPVWTWDFGHGSAVNTTDPGAGWPNGRLRHTYPRRGIYRVRVTSEWRAVYDAGGATDLPVAGAITQSAWFDLRVREARRFLQPRKGS